jgi:hypothetical protein
MATARLDRALRDAILRGRMWREIEEAEASRIPRLADDAARRRVALEQAERAERTERTHAGAGVGR